MIKTHALTKGLYVEIDPSADIVCNELDIGDCVTILKDVKIRGNKIKIGNYVRFCPNSEIGGGGGVPNIHSNVTIGNNVLVCAYVLINNAREVVIGDDVGLGQYVHIWTHGGWLSTLDGYPCKFASVKIGSHVWIPERTSVLAGVTIGDHVIVGNNSLVDKDLPGGCFAAGIPVKILKEGVFPKPLSQEEKDKLLERLVKEWSDEHPFYLKIVDYLGGGRIRFKTLIFDTNTMEISGQLDEEGEDLRDHLRRNGVKFFTGKPFKSMAYNGERGSN